MSRDRLYHPAALLALTLGLLGAALLSFKLYGPASYVVLVGDFPELARAFVDLRVPQQVVALAWLAGVGCVVLLVGMLVVLWRAPLALRVGRALLSAALALGVWYCYKVLSITDLIVIHDLKILGARPTSVDLFDMRWALCWPVLLALVWVVFMQVWSWRAATLRAYGFADVQPPAPGDRVLENVRTHGRDPRYRKSFYSSVLLHLFVLFMLPWLLNIWGCVEAYTIPKGSGNPVVALVQVVKPKKKPKKKLVVNPNSFISFHQPDLDDSKLLEQTEQATQMTYTADASRVHGKPGQGGGKQGGWPDGMENAVVRFIRLEYDGEGWDDGMTAMAGNADANFLREFGKITGFKTRKTGEAHRISLLTRYPEGQAPPFLFMTGEGGVRITSGEQKILRDYLLKGGMLFADAGTSGWDRNFRAMLNSLMPGHRVLEIADDDPIFQQPFSFPDGQPIFAPHGGLRAKGIKVKGRWAVYYSPGDLNDLWKDGGSGADKQRVQRGYQMGVNIVYYAFTHYLRETRQQRK